MTSLIAKSPETKKPAPRFKTDKVLVTAKTIGTKILFKMPVENLSLSGMLITWNEKDQVPFNINTILELDVITPMNQKKDGLQCLAKVVHARKLENGRRSFGVQIIQAEEDDSLAWNRVVTHISSEAAAKS
jgi:hypothetical protein